MSRYHGRTYPRSVRLGGANEIIEQRKTPARSRRWIRGTGRAGSSLVPTVDSSRCKVHGKAKCVRGGRAVAAPAACWGLGGEENREENISSENRVPPLHFFPPPAAGRLFLSNPRRDLKTTQCSTPWGTRAPIIRRNYAPLPSAGHCTAFHSASPVDASSCSARRIRMERVASSCLCRAARSRLSARAARRSPVVVDCAWRVVEPCAEELSCSRARGGCSAVDSLRPVALLHPWPPRATASVPLLVCRFLPRFLDDDDE